MRFARISSEKVVSAWAMSVPSSIVCLRSAENDRGLGQSEPLGQRPQGVARALADPHLARHQLQIGPQFGVAGAEFAGGSVERRLQAQSRIDADDKHVQEVGKADPVLHLQLPLSAAQIGGGQIIGHREQRPEEGNRFGRSPGRRRRRDGQEAEGWKEDKQRDPDRREGRRGVRAEQARADQLRPERALRLRVDSEAGRVDGEPAALGRIVDLGGEALNAAIPSPHPLTVSQCVRGREEQGGGAAEDQDADEEKRHIGSSRPSDFEVHEAVDDQVPHKQENEAHGEHARRRGVQPEIRIIGWADDIDQEEQSDREDAESVAAEAALGREGAHPARQTEALPQHARESRQDLAEVAARLLRDRGRRHEEAQFGIADPVVQVLERLRHAAPVIDLVDDEREFGPGRFRHLAHDESQRDRQRVPGSQASHDDVQDFGQLLAEARHPPGALGPQPDADEERPAETGGDQPENGIVRERQQDEDDECEPPVTAPSAPIESVVPDCSTNLFRRRTGADPPRRDCCRRRTSSSAVGPEGASVSNRRRAWLRPRTKPPKPSWNCRTARTTSPNTRV
jgi:hypothetical protein